jgi:hypothetical protein
MKYCSMIEDFLVDMTYCSMINFPVDMTYCSMIIFPVDMTYCSMIEDFPVDMTYCSMIEDFPVDMTYCSKYNIFLRIYRDNCDILILPRTNCSLLPLILRSNNRVIYKWQFHLLILILYLNREINRWLVILLISSCISI